jgi:DNA-binding Lrp family transcriptional regulator
MDKLILKVGFYSIYERVTTKNKVFVADSGKIIYSNRFKKYFPNPNRDVKEFKNLEDAKKYAQNKITKHSMNKKKKLEKLPKSLYLIVMKEEKTGKTFVKVGITSKRFILRRFSKDYGYEGYTLETILRRIDTKDAEKLEEQIKDKLNKKRGVKKFKPLLENFSGYSECFSYDSMSEIILVFDTLTKDC